MGWYWRKSLKILPGVRINWSRSGPSVSVGPRGAKMNFGPRGTYVSTSIPGTGLYYRQKVGNRKVGATRSENRKFSYNYGNASTCSQESLLRRKENRTQNGKGFWVAFAVIIGFIFCIAQWYICFAIWVACCLVIAIITKVFDNTPASTTATDLPNSALDSKDETPIADVAAIVKQVEGNWAQIEACIDKAKLPSYYRKTISLFDELEAMGGASIYGLPIDLAKSEFLETYRKQMNLL